MGAARTMQYALAAGVAGLVSGYLTHRGHSQRRSYAVIQATEWFIAAGGAHALAELARRSLDGPIDVDPVERVVHVDHAVVDARGYGLGGR